MVRECVGDAIGAARELNVDPEFVAEAEEKLARLRGYQVADDGSLMEWSNGKLTRFRSAK